MINWVPPAAIFIIGAFGIPLFKGRARQAYLLSVPVIAFINLLNMGPGTAWVFNFLGYEIIFGRVDELTTVFGYLFVIMAFIGTLYALHLKDPRELMAAFLYAGSSLGVVYAGDYLTLFLFWEIMAVSSTYLIWNRRTKSSQAAGLRYILIHIFGGLILLSGIIITVADSGTIEFTRMGLHGTGAYLILIGFALNSAIPPLSAWLSDAYPESTVTGAIFLSTLTTKTAVYVLLRGFPGTELLVVAGVVMALYGIGYAVLENDMRRLLAYHIISQVGFMIAGIGMGTHLALSGSAAHAFAYTVNKGLLFMATGAIIHMTGKRKLTELGGLYKTMPLTLILFMIGALSISSFPLLSAFVSKSMIISAAAEEHRAYTALLLTLASSGTFLSLGLKLPYFAFFGKGSGVKAADPPLNMLLGMAAAAFLCFLVGIYPDVLYNALPYAVHYAPFTAEHIVPTLQLLLFTALAFFMLLKIAKPKAKLSLDTDWFYRNGARAFMWVVYKPVADFSDGCAHLFSSLIPSALTRLSRNPVAILKITVDRVLLLFISDHRRVEIERRIHLEKEIYPGDIIKHWPIGSTVLWITLFLLIYLLVYFL